MPTAYSLDILNSPADSGSINGVLHTARRLVSDGDGHRATELTLRVLDHALDVGNFELQGDAMHCMAVTELRILGRFERALDLSERAAICYRRVHADAGESAALAVHAVAAVRLGRHERAMESALLAARLAESVGEAPKLVTAYQALGVAAYSGRNFDESRNAYQRAIRHASEAATPLNAFELHVDLASMEAFSYFTERGLSGRRLALDGLERHVREAELLLVDGGNISLSPGSHTNNLLVHSLSSTFHAVWTGASNALEHKERFAAIARDAQRPWFGAVAQWIDAEIALGQSRLENARLCAQEMIRIALSHSHETLVANGYNLLSHVCQRQGDLKGAIEALQALARREQVARAESLRSRVAVIEWQMDLRRQERQLERLESDSRLFEKLAMEDALTGLANRRALHTHVKRWFPRIEDSSAACVALVDVDQFKQVNDRYSHQVGDEVLKIVGRLLRTNVREGDVAVRWAGDEFVLVLPATKLVQANEMRARFHDAVARYDWESVAPGLQMSLSIGIAEAHTGETFESTLERADAEMYANKRMQRTSLPGTS